MLVLISLVDMVCEVESFSVSVLDCEIDATVFLFPENVSQPLRWIVNSTRKRKQAWRQRFSRRCPRERQWTRCLSVSGTELHHREKERHNNNKQHGLPEVGESPRSDRSVQESGSECDANHTWNPRERVIIRGMEDYLARGQRSLVEVEEFQAHSLCPTDVWRVLFNVLAKNACNQGGCRSFVFIKRKEGHLVADVRQYQDAILREGQETYHKEFHEITECMNVKQRRLLATMERKQNKI